MKELRTSVAFIAMVIVLSMTISACSEVIDHFASSRPIRFRLESVKTRSTPITTSSLTEFHLVAIADGSYHDNARDYSSGMYFEDRVSKSGEEWIMSEDHFWLNQVNLHFWCWSPSDDALDSAAEGLLSVSMPSAGSNSLSFSYSMPESVDGNDASNQKDIVFAGNSESRTFGGDGGITGHSSSNAKYSRNDNEVDIVFHHALSEICFAVSPDDGSFDTEAIGIDKVTLSNIHGSGNCTFTLPSTFNWSVSGTDKQYSQNYDATFGTLPSGWTSGTFKDNGGDSHLIYTCSNAFLVIPQTLSGAVLSVTFRRLDDDSTIVKEKVLDNDTWRAGEYYKYKIGAKNLGHDIDFSAMVMDWEEIVYELNQGV